MLLVVVSDPVGIRTRDPQLRRLLLYPAELPDLVGMRLSHERHFSVSLGLTAIPPLNPNSRSLGYFATMVAMHKPFGFQRTIRLC